MTLTYITVRGTGERQRNRRTMLGQVAARVAELTDVTWVDVDYPASIAVFNPTGDIAGPSEKRSRQIGVANLVKAIRAARGHVVVSGYSLGALVVADLLAAKAKGLYRDVHIDAVVNIANPARRVNESLGRVSSGYGLDGPGNRPAIAVHELANPADLITSAPKNSPWRMFADKIRAFTFRDIDGWLRDMMKQLSGRQVIQGQHNIFEPGWWQAYADAPRWLQGYALDGQHTTAYGDHEWWDGKERVTAIELAARTVARYA